MRAKELAAAWAERLIEITRLALSPDKTVRGYFHGTTACLSALYRAERSQDGPRPPQPCRVLAKRWAVKALAALRRQSEAIRLAEASRGPWTSNADVDRVCKEILLSTGAADEAYRRYGLTANRAGTYLATFRPVARKYPAKNRRAILHNPVRARPGDEAKWFAAAKDEVLYAEALTLVNSSRAIHGR